MSATPEDDDDFVRAAEALRLDRSFRLPEVRRAAVLFDGGHIANAETIVRNCLKADPEDSGALRLLAEIATRQGQHEEAETLWQACVVRDPASLAYRYAHGQALLRARKFEAALAASDALLAQAPHNPLCRALRGLALDGLADRTAAAAQWRELLDDHPEQPDMWLRYGHALRATGMREASIEAYRKAIEIAPTFGRAYWSLANLKTYRFGDEEIAQMESALSAADVQAEDRICLHFALGKAHADRQRYEQSFSHYAKGNALHRLTIQHDPEKLAAYVSRCKAVFTPRFFHERAGAGFASNAPIFLVGMMRAGSTLVEQILACHSEIEGTSELSELVTLSNRLAISRGKPVPEVLMEVDLPALEEMGRAYIENVRVYRETGRPFFTDKMGANFIHVGLIQLILPAAKIVDVRRHPLACGLSNFTEIFAGEQNFAYRLSDIGRYYRDYAALMAHWDRVLPGKVHRVFYEQLVADPEKEIRRLLDYLGLPFEPACLEFHKSGRSVTTASSEQVRRPIYADATARWRHYEPWLGPLKAALGPVLDEYPSMPAAVEA